MSVVVISLLDTVEGRPIQTWCFEHPERITLGRLSENDVVLTDPRVSRSHAYLHQLPSGAWELVSLSDQQILIQGKLVRQVCLESEAEFRLGRQGCSLKFELAEQGIDLNSQTVHFDSVHFPELELDTRKMEEEVSAIVSADYFQDLKNYADHLRARRERENTLR